MIVLLALLLMISLFIAYTLCGKNILSSWVIAHFMYLFSTIVYIIAYDYYGTDISVETVFVIIFALFFWGLGELTIALIFKQKPKKKLENKIYKPIEISKKHIIFIAIFMFLVAIWRFYEIFQISILAGNPGDIFATIEYARMYMLQSDGFSSNIILSQLLVISECITYYFIFIYFYDFYLCNVKSKKFLIVIPICFLQMMGSTSRTEYIKLIALYCTTMFILKKIKNKWQSKDDFEIIRKGLYAIILFLVIFRLAGYMTGSSLRNDLWENLAKYASSSLYGLSFYLNSVGSNNILFGEETLANIYSIMRQLGFDIPFYSHFHEFYYWSNGNSNVYTGLRKWIQDYTVIGMLISRYLLGMIYAFVFESLRNESFYKINPIKIIIYGILMYPIVMTAIEDVYSGTVITTKFIYIIIYLHIIKFCIGKINHDKYNKEL